MDRLAAAESRLAAALDQLEALAARPAADAQALVADVDVLALALDDARESNHQLETRLAELTRELAALKAADAGAAPEARTAGAETPAEEALGELEEAKAEIATLRQALAAAEARNATTQADLFRTENANGAAARKLDETIARLDRFIAE